MRKRILFVNLPYIGHINSSLNLVRELLNRGYEVSYIDSPKFKDKIENSGAKFIPYQNFKKANYIQECFSMYRCAYNTALDVGQEYDLLVYDAEFFLGHILAQALNIPAVKTYATMGINGPVNQELIRKSKINFSMKYQFNVRMVTKIWARGLKLKTGNAFSEIAECPADVNIIYTAKEFQPLAETFSDEYYFVGPSIHNSRVTLDIELDKIQCPIIYISLGTLFNKKRSFFKKCIKAFANKEYVVIITTGNSKTRRQLGKLPDNVFAYDYVPQHIILDKAALFISGCGMNSVNEAMQHGVPILAAPVVWDQVVDANRIEELCLGKKIDVDFTSSKKIFETAKEILSSVEIKQGTLKMKQVMDKYTGAVEAADIIERYLVEKQIKSTAS
jgi:MGT family glycosyltransferase